MFRGNYLQILRWRQCEALVAAGLEQHGPGFGFFASREISPIFLQTFPGKTDRSRDFELDDHPGTDLRFFGQGYG